MLYDPKWETEVKFETSLSGFIAWLETKDPRKKYEFYECSGRCLLGQFMAESGIPWIGAPDRVSGDWGKSSYSKVGTKLFGVATETRPAPFDVLSSRPHTYGAALKRARRLQATRTA